MTVEDLIRLLQNVGVPIVGLYFLARFVGLAVKWIAEKIALPMVTRAVAFLDQLAIKLEEDAKDRKLNNERAERSEVRTEQIKDTMHSVATELKGVATGLSEVRQVVVTAKNVIVKPEKEHPPGGG